MRSNIAVFLRFLVSVGCLGFGITSWAAGPYGTIAGTVLDQKGSSVSNAKVTARYECLAPCVMSTVIPQTEADEQGHYEFKRLQYGRYSVSAEKAEDDYPPLWQPLYSTEKQPEVELSEANRAVTLDLTLRTKAGVLVGTVADNETGDPLDANVDFRSTIDPRRTLTGSGLTNARFRVLVPSDTPVVMRVSKPGYDDWLFTRDGVVTAIYLGPGETLQLHIKLTRSQPSRPDDCR